MSLLIPEAMAQTSGTASQGSGFEPIIMLVIFGLIFYFMIWRPQSKRAKDHKNMVTTLEKGNEVVISGGLAGKVTKVADDFIVMEISEGVEVKVQKAAVANVLPNGTLKAI